MNTHKYLGDTIQKGQKEGKDLCSYQLSCYFVLETVVSYQVVSYLFPYHYNIYQCSTKLLEKKIDEFDPSKLAHACPSKVRVTFKEAIQLAYGRRGT